MTRSHSETTLSFELNVPVSALGAHVRIGMSGAGERRRCVGREVAPAGGSKLRANAARVIDAPRRTAGAGAGDSD